MSQALGGLLSPALAELLTSFPFSLFLLLDLDFVILGSKFFYQNGADNDSTHSIRKDLPFPECLDVKRAKLGSESTERRRR